ncbi:MAG: endonuclease/exonuclease/phosphatase family protein [Gemmataceae bacterium]
MKVRWNVLALALLLFLPLVSQAQDGNKIRVATYNIRFLNADNLTQNRKNAIQAVIKRLDADVIGLQEIKDRDALEAVFDKNEWDLIIDDSSRDALDLAVAVRKSNRWKVLTPLKAGPKDFLFPNDGAMDTFFPGNRDVLNVKIEVNGVDFPVHIFVVHAKSRIGGQKQTDNRRVGAAELLVKKIDDDFEDVPFVLLGDFNDNPDNRALNILETGDSAAGAKSENLPGSFLLNLTEELLISEHVSWSSQRLAISGNKFVTSIPGSRRTNMTRPGRRTKILFDQILIPTWMKGHYVKGSVRVFNELPDQAQTASDHLPVYADFRITKSIIDPEVSVGIFSLLPNPNGRDAGNEVVVLKNFGGKAQSLENWTLTDRAGHVVSLKGSIAAGAIRTIKLKHGQMPLTNSGDEIRLLNDQDEVVHQVRYVAADARPGNVIRFDSKDNEN